MTKKNEKTILVDISLNISIDIPEEMDPDTDAEYFNKLLGNQIIINIKENKHSYVGDAIEHHHEIDKVNNE